MKNPGRSALAPLEVTYGRDLWKKHLSRDLYEDADAALWELIKNALCACMPRRDVWDPRPTHVELTLTRHHPLCDGLALLCMDNGRGFTDEDNKRFSRIAGSGDAGVRHGGASQKQLGRLAYFVLNQRFAMDDPDAGFYILTRTSSSGDVTVMHATARSMDWW